jgi:protein-disulfide isomerase
MPKIWWIAAAAVVVVAGAIGWWQLSGASTAPRLGPAPTTASPQNPGGTQSALAAEADDHVLGNADAPITIVEYASLTCPHCANFQRDVAPQIKQEWLQTGKAKLIYRHFPLNGQALLAAKLSECVKGERFFGMLDVLFQQMDRWAVSDPVPPLTRLGKLGGLSDEQIKACLADADAEKKILQKQLIAQNQLGVTSTPTFFINGRKIVGAESYESFRQALAAAGS